MCHPLLRPSILCGCLLAALDTSTAVAQEPAGSVAVRDPLTGELRAPTAAELRALRPTPAPGTAQTGPQTAQPVVRADGTRAVRLGEAGMVYSVATRSADGKLHEHCVSGEAASQAVKSEQSAPAPKEHGHEHR